jgi:hypothetical protein
MVMPQAGGFIMKEKQKRLARKMRREEGLSVGDIATAVSVSKSTVSRWVADVELTKEQQERLLVKQKNNLVQKGADTIKEKAMRRRLRWQQEGRRRPIDNPRYVAGCMLYWAEGSKSRNTLCFANSDPEMMRVFISFLRDFFDVDESTLTIRVNCYLNNGLTIEEIRQHWLDVTQLPGSCWRKPIIKKGGHSRGKLPYGTCTLKVGNCRVVQTIFGSIQEFAGFEKEEWLWNL